MARVLLAVLRRIDLTTVTRTAFGATLNCHTGDFVQRYIIAFGVWEPAITRWMTESLKPGDLFVDVGANIGYHSLLAARLVGAAGEVVAIEASPSIFAALRDNVARNEAGCIQLSNVAVASADGVVPFYRADAHNSGLSSLLSGEGRSFEADVPAKTLPHILLPSQRARVKLIKIDIEGGEWAVISGMLAWLDQSPADPEIIVEISPDSLRQFGKTAHDVFDAFTSRGFHAYELENGYRPREYAPGHALAWPERVIVPPERQMDILFSRDATIASRATRPRMTVRMLLGQLRTGTGLTPHLSQPTRA